MLQFETYWPVRLLFDVTLRKSIGNPYWGTSNLPKNVCGKAQQLQNKASDSWVHTLGILACAMEEARGLPASCSIRKQVGQSVFFSTECFRRALESHAGMAPNLNNTCEPK